MHKLTESRLLAGFIYGDSRTKEYVYLPGSELDSDTPFLIYEEDGHREDVPMDRALEIIEKRKMRAQCSAFAGRVHDASNKNETAGAFAE